MRSRYRLLIRSVLMILAFGVLVALGIWLPLWHNDDYIPPDGSVLLLITLTDDEMEEKVIWPPDSSSDGEVFGNGFCVGGQAEIGPDQFERTIEIPYDGRRLVMSCDFATLFDRRPDVPRVQVLTEGIPAEAIDVAEPDPEVEGEYPTWDLTPRNSTLSVTVKPAADW